MSASGEMSEGKIFAKYEKQIPYADAYESLFAHAALRTAMLEIASLLKESYYDEYIESASVELWDKSDEMVDSFNGISYWIFKSTEPDKIEQAVEFWVQFAQDDEQAISDAMYLSCQQDVFRFTELSDLQRQAWWYAAFVWADDEDAPDEPPVNPDGHRANIMARMPIDIPYDMQSMSAGDWSDHDVMNAYNTKLELNLSEFLDYSMEKDKVKKAFNSEGEKRG